MVIAESSLWPSKEVLCKTLCKFSIYSQICLALGGMVRTNDIFLQLKIDSLSEENWAALSMLDKGSDGRIFWLDKIWKGLEFAKDF